MREDRILDGVACAIFEQDAHALNAEGLEQARCELGLGARVVEHALLPPENMMRASG
jgi:hypothetical protein